MNIKTKIITTAVSVLLACCYANAKTQLEQAEASFVSDKMPNKTVGTKPPVSHLSAMKPKTASSEYPNIVLIYADDLGYGDLSCYGATKISTPNIDRLAKEGRLFADAHSTSAVCSPSRYALLTGEYPLRIGIYGAVFCKSQLIIDTKKTTLASMLKRKGYATACVGKWHLGFTSNKKPDWNQDLKPGPLEVGFDYYYGIPVVNSHTPYVYVENHRVIGLEADDPLVYKFAGKTHGKPYPEKKTANPRKENLIGGKAAHDLYVDEEIAEHLTGKALQWMNDQTAPFFLYYASHNIHHPFTPHPFFQGKSECGLYGDFVQELDWSVGQLIAAVERFGVWENTIFVFTSDNGGMFNEGGKKAIEMGHSPNGKLKGQKFGAWEGGHRVPFITCWPGKIPAGSTSDAFIANMDLLPTFAAITDQKLAPDEARDGVNQLAALVDEDGVSARDELLIIQPNKQTHTSLRQGDWVYIPGAGDGGFTKAQQGEQARQLYNLKEDPYQKNNRIADNPERADAMAKLLSKMLAERGMTTDKPAGKIK